MFPIPDALAAFYLACFAIGFLFTFASLFLGLSHDALHLPGISHGDGGDAHVGGLDHAGGVDHGGGDASADGADHGGGQHDAAPRGGHGISPINISTIMAFLTWFGGAGYVLRVYVGLWGLVSLVAASLVGLLGGAMIFYFLVRVLLPGERVMDPADYQLVGTVARVTVPIASDRPGEIVFSKGGTRRSDGARSADGGPIGPGTEVVIVRYERGMAYVEPWSSYVAKG